MGQSGTVLVIDDSPTILKVVSLVLAKAGFSAVTAADGEAGLESARAERPDLILLDFVMPRMNGYQVCRALAQDPGLSDIPVVLMSAKGDQVGERFVKVMGIVDYITKPFSPEALAAVVTHSVAKYGNRASADRTEPLIRGADLSDRAEAENPATTAEATRESALATVRERIAGIVGAKIAGLFALAEAARDPDSAVTGNEIVPTDATAIAEAARAALDDDTLWRLLRTAAPALASAPQPPLSGDLSIVPLADVLQLLDNQKHTGTLTANRGAGHLEIVFNRGRIDLASATGMSDELVIGRFLVAAELITEDELGAVLAAREPGAGFLGAQLIAEGRVSEADLKHALSRQTAELIYEALRWSFGTFSLAAGNEVPPAAADASLALDVEGILMEGFRRVDEWHLIEREIDDFELVFLRNEDAVAQMGRGRLTRDELAILELVNGKHTVKDIIRTSRMGSFEVSKMLYRLRSIKLIRRRVLPVAV
ncbi:MAG TPA: response regulator [Kofleriaceae bacterium]|nr:response regulator [Kofleriaceae bacterium]